MSRASKKQKKSTTVTIPEFSSSLIHLFESCFTMPRITAPFMSLLSNHNMTTYEVLYSTNVDEKVWFNFMCILQIQMRKYRPYMGVSPRFVPFFRPLYWQPYLVFRVGLKRWNLPRDIIWMILERAEITLPITEYTLRDATRMCVKHSEYIERYFLKNRRLEYSSREQGIYEWGEKLVEKLTSFLKK